MTDQQNAQTTVILSKFEAGEIDHAQALDALSKQGMEPQAAEELLTVAGGGMGDIVELP